MMATADLISSFLNNEMNPDRERQFLLSVAASDALRLELKSHLLVDRILVSQSQRSQVPDGVRNAIFAEAGVAGGIAPAAPSAANRAPSPGFFSRLGGRATIALAAAAFFGAGYATGIGTDAAPTAATMNPRPNVEQVAAPRTSEPNASSTSMSNDVAALRTSPSVTVRESGPRTDRASAQTPTTVGAAQSNPSAMAPLNADVTAPSGTSDPLPPNVRPRPNGQGQPASVKAEIRKSTEEERNQQSNPLDGEGEPKMQ